MIHDKTSLRAKPSLNTYNKTKAKCYTIFISYSLTYFFEIYYKTYPNKGGRKPASFLLVNRFLRPQVG